MEAKELFKQLGFEKVSQDKNLLVYSCEDDYNKIFINFDLKIEHYTVIWDKFIDHMCTDIPMSERPRESRHSGYYGHWQSQTCIYLSTRIHNAIHQQLIELH